RAALLLAPRCAAPSDNTDTLQKRLPTPCPNWYCRRISAPPLPSPAVSPAGMPAPPHAPPQPRLSIPPNPILPARSPPPALLQSSPPQAPPKRPLPAPHSQRCPSARETQINPGWRRLRRVLGQEARLEKPRSANCSAAIPVRSRPQ